ncbi:MAG: hypothetical protein H7Y38_12725, partial [Armatimonadetes bacterium]|nr:hypothetical protein [Armatimonadota bacterium]
MAETYQTTPLSADNVAADVDRKQNQRLAIASFASVATNVLFLMGAANGMNEKPLSLEQAPPVYVTFTAVATPAPLAPTPPPVATPAPKVVAKADPLPTPAPRKPEVANTPPPRRPRVQVAKVRPRVRPQPREITPPREKTPREIEPTPPPVRPVEETIAETRQQNQEANRTRGAETQVAASGANTNANSRRNASNASDSPSNAGASSAAGGSRSRVSQGIAGASATNPGDFRSPNATRNNSTGAPSLRTGIAGGSDAPGTAGIVGETRATGSIIGSAGNIAGPSLANSTGPRRGLNGGLSGARDKILTQSESAGGAANGDFTVAKGTGLRPGAIVARTGPAAGGAAGTLSNATLGARISGGGNGSGSGGAESLGVFRRSTGLGGGSNGPVGLRVGTGPGAGRGTGAVSGVANGDPGGVSGQGLAG